LALEGTLQVAYPLLVLRHVRAEQECMESAKGVMVQGCRSRCPREEVRVMGQEVPGGVLGAGVMVRSGRRPRRPFPLLRPGAILSTR
jgi:hypothetical protein